MKRRRREIVRRARVKEGSRALRRLGARRPRRVRARARRDLAAAGKLFVPAVGPGYDDTRIRPWNAPNTRDRERGQYYARLWQQALAAQPHAISITSYNEWGEGLCRK